MIRRQLIAVVVASWACSGASAGTDPLADLFDVQIDWSGGTWTASSTPGSYTIQQTVDPVTGNILYDIVGAWSEPGGAWEVNFAITFDPDPFISNAFVQLANANLSIEDFSITVTSPVLPALGAPTTMTGSVSGFVGDGNGMLDMFGNGATVQTFDGLPFYRALVDGVGVRDLYGDPQTHSAPLGLTSDIDMMEFIGELGPAVLSSIGITNSFRLTGGDSAGFTSTFFIIPTPGVTMLLALAGAGSIRRRRR